VEPFSVLELVVGSGGGAGVCGSELQTVDIQEQRRRMAIRRDKEIHMAKGEKMIHRDDDEYAVALLMEESCGVTLGGVPGGKGHLFTLFPAKTRRLLQYVYYCCTSYRR
jgi:hypothetical protein